MELKQSKRAEAKLRLSLQGPAGSGKSMSALITCFWHLWRLYQLLTGSNKSSYIYSFLDRSLNAFTFTESLVGTTLAGSIEREECEPYEAPQCDYQVAKGHFIFLCRLQFFLNNVTFISVQV